MINPIQVVIGTAGHIDHGKTSIVKALTGTDTDHLKEEKNRGMTIDIGFAYFNDKITIIDVPGHEKFIKNMVAGISTIHIALIVVSADDGLMPQTHEHIEILHLLNIEHAIVVLSKIDKVENSIIELVESEIRDRIKSTNFCNSKILKTSTKNGIGINSLKNEIINLSGEIKKLEDRSIFYMPIDRVFSKKGFGTIVTGTVLSGELKNNSEVDIFSGKNPAIVRSLQTHGKETSIIKIGDRAAINLSNINQSDLKRGSVVVEINKIKPTSKVIANIKMVNIDDWKIKDKQLVHIHIGTSRVVAKVITYGKKILPGQSANVLLDFNHRIAPMCDQRFIVRSISPMQTIAGGKILDNNPRYKKNELKKNIHQIHTDRSKRFFQRITMNWKKPLSALQWSEVFNVSKDEIEKWMNVHRMLKVNEKIFTLEVLEMSKDEVLGKVEGFHKKNKYKKYISKEELLGSIGFDKIWFEYVIDNMKSDIITNDAGYSLIKNKINLSDEDSSIAKEIEYSLLEAKFDLLSSLKVYSRDQKKALNILYLLKESENIIQIDSDLWMHTDNYKILKKKLILHFKEYPNLSVPEFKKIISVTRKNAIPILEFCDKIKFTTRVDNYRIEGEKLNA